MDVENFGSGLHGLGHVQVHLVTVEIGVVRRRIAQVHTERRPWQYLHLVTHHTHFVQRRLTVEHNLNREKDIAFYN